MSAPHQPSRPYLLFHPKFIRTYGNKKWEYQMHQRIYQLGWFNEDCFAIDNKCRKFPLLDVVNHGLAWTIWNLPIPGFQGRGGKVLDVEYVFGEPTQMTFEEMRDFYVERVCAMRRSGQNGETQAQFRARNAAYTDVDELIKSVGLMGKWPAVRESRGRKRK